MTAGNEPFQCIARLTPLADVLAHIDAHVKPVAPRSIDVSIGRGSTLAEDVVVPHALPANAIALRDGFAVDSDSVRDASSYAPVILSSPLIQVEVGDILPACTDAVLPFDAVVHHGTGVEIVSPTTPGDGVLPAGIDAVPTVPLLRAGTLLTARDIAVLRAVNMSSVSARKPKIAVARGRPDDDSAATAAARWLADAIAAAGASVLCDEYTHSIDPARSEASDIDAIIAVGGTGSGRHDRAVATLAGIGEVLVHGIAIAPGETAAFGLSAARPVLLIPGRLDAAIACWLLIGRHLLGRLSGGQTDSTGCAACLTRKVSSTLGITELVPVARQGDNAEPLGTAYLPLRAIARADGWIVVPAQSEGYPAGSSVHVRPFP